jgi:transcriptional regulator GlxA family with amidase domain
MSALAPVVHSPVTVFSVWEIGHDPDTTQGDMTMRELDRLKCIQGLIDGQLKQHAVATRLGLTTRQVRRLVRQYEQQGPVGLISKLRNRPSNRRLKSDAAEHAFGILRARPSATSN